MKNLFDFELFHINSFSLTVGSIISSAIVIVINVILINVVSKLLRAYFVRKGESSGRQKSIIKLVKYILWTFAIILSLQVLGLNITFLIASSAALLVGLGLGMQIIFKDFMSGLLLLVEGTIKAGDIVEINNQVLQVKEIGWRTSTVITREDNVVIIPNHKFTEENVINWTHDDNPTRFHIEVGVDYSSDVRLVERCLLESLVNQPDVIKDEAFAPFVRFINFGASSLDFELIFWSENLFRVEATKSRIRFEITRVFRENDITIPFTQIVMHKA